jgi:parallel beta-helix repeat protein
MLKKKLSITVVVLFLCISVIPSVICNNSSFENTIYVDDDNTSGPWDGTQEHPYQYIQDGIDASENGDTVYVYSGEYHEDVLIRKSITLKGENRENTSIDSTQKCIIVEAKNAKITGFTLRNSGGGIVIEESENIIIDGNIMIHNDNGVALFYCNNIVVKNNIMDHNGNGLYIWESFYSSISNNSISFCSNDGIYLLYSGNINITGNDIHGNRNWGILLWDGDYSIIKDNVVSNSGQSGISVGHGTHHAIIDNNTITYNDDDGICTNSDYCRITRNTILSNDRYGINTNAVMGIIVSHNYVKSNLVGIRIYSADYDFYVFNNITDNLRYGIEVGSGYYDSRHNHFLFNNIINNSGNAWDQTRNFWSLETRMMGNYWDDYNGSDNDGNGIGDTPYNISGGDNKDFYPSIKPISIFGNLPPEKPTIVGPSSGSSNRRKVYTFKLADPDGDDVYVYVNWGDGKKIYWIGPYSSGEGLKIGHTWLEKGTFIISAKTMDVFGEESDLATLEVSMPKNKMINPFERFLENHPYMFPILRKILTNELLLVS